MKPIRSIRISAVLAFSLSACGGQDKTPETPETSWNEAPPAVSETQAAESPAAESPGGGSEVSDGTQAAPNAPVPVTETVTLTVIGVQLDPSLAQLCKIALPKAFFEYDSANLRPRADDMLEQLATCLKSQPLQGRRIRVTGYADPRGSDEYNKKLGRSRAQSVADYLAERGVARERVQVVSRGEQQASGAPSTYPFERRVDIQLADSAPQRPSR